MGFKTLLVNQGYEPLKIIDWKKAFVLLFREKAEAVAYYGREVRTIKESFPVPAVIRLYKRVRNHGLWGGLSRRALYLRDGSQCQYCLKKFSRDKLTMDHVIPKSRGGQKTWDNIVTACVPCNNYKADRTPKEAGMTLNKQPVKPIFIRRAHSPEQWHPFLWE